MDPTPARKVAVLLPINAAGHFQGLLAIANKLRDDHNVRCVFIVAGPPHNRVVEDHGHELMELDDLAEPYWASEVESDEDLSQPVSEEKGRRLRVARKRVPFRGSARWPQFVARNPDYFKDVSDPDVGMSKLLELVIPFSTANSEQLDRAIDSLEPDIIMVDSSIIQPTVLKAEEARPWILVWSANPISLLESKLPGKVKPKSFSGAKLYTKEERDRIRQEEPDLWMSILDEWAKRGVAGEKMAASMEMARQFYQNNGCDKQLARTCGIPASWAPQIHSPHLNIYMFPAAIDYDQDDDLFEYPPRWLRCDSLIRKTTGENEAAENASWGLQIETKMRDQKLKSVVYFSLGSVASGEPALIQRYVDYLGEDHSDRLYIVSKGVNGDQVQLSARNMLGGNYLPQHFLLQQSDMAIIHGGNNSLTEALYYGKPMIVLPAFGDQPDNAQRVEDLGLGRRLDLRKCTREQLLQSIDAVLGDEGLRARVHAIGVEMRARDDLSMVSSIVMDMIEHKRLRAEVAEKYGIRLDRQNESPGSS